MTLKDIGVFPFTPGILFTVFSPLYSERDILNIFSFDYDSVINQNDSRSSDVDTRTAFGFQSIGPDSQCFESVFRPIESPPQCSPVEEYSSGTEDFDYGDDYEYVDVSRTEGHY